MDNLTIRAVIAAKTDRKNNLERLWEEIKNLNAREKFYRDTYLEVKYRIKNEVYECEKAIREAESLLLA